MPINSISDGYQGILTLLLGGPGNEIEVNLTPDASNNIDISNNQTVIVSDLCAYIAIQPCMRTYGLININQNMGGLFSDNSTILQGNQFVIITCSDGHLLFKEADSAFTLDIFTVPSDQVTVSYTNASPAFTTSTTWPLTTNFHIDYAEQDWAVISPLFAGLPTITDTDIIDKPLLCVGLDHAPITEIGKIGCVQLCTTVTSDAEYICHLLDCCSDVENYLMTHYFSDTAELIAHISDKCTIQYNGPVCGEHGFLNLSTCRLRIQGAVFRCSDRTLHL